MAAGAISGIGEQRSGISAVDYARAVSAAPSVANMEAAESSLSRYAFAREMTARAIEVSQSNRDGSINAAASIGRSPADVATVDVKITESARVAAARPKSAQMHLSSTARTIFAVLDAYPRGAGPMVGARPLFLDAAIEFRSRNQNLPGKFVDNSVGKPSSDMRESGDVVSGGGSQLPEAPHPLDRISRKWQQAAHQEEALKTPVLDRPVRDAAVTAGEFVAQDSPSLPGNGASAPALQQVLSVRHALPGLPLTGALRDVLKRTITESGLFYESHLRMLAIDPEQGIAIARHEPQGRIAIGARPLDSEADKSRKESSSDFEQVRTVVRQQIEFVSTQTIQWQGLVWPEATVRWEIRKYDKEKDGGKDPGIDEHCPPRPWITNLTLDLPHLGSVAVRIAIQGDKVGLRLSGEKSEYHLRDWMEEFRVRLRDIGMSMESMSFAARGQIDGVSPTKTTGSS